MFEFAKGKITDYKPRSMLDIGIGATSTNKSSQAILKKYYTLLYVILLISAVAFAVWSGADYMGHQFAALNAALH